MQRITITAGTGYDRHGNPLDAQDVQTALSGIRSMLALEFGGYTETETLGGWINGNGELVAEPGRRWIIVSDFLTEYAAMQKARVVADYVRDVLRQESVMIEREAVVAEFREAFTATAAESTAA